MSFINRMSINIQMFVTENITYDTLLHLLHTAIDKHPFFPLFYSNIQPLFFYNLILYLFILLLYYKTHFR